MTKVAKVWYQDHHSQRSDRESAIEASDCLNWNLGEVVYEDDEWIRLCNEQTNLTEGKEDWGVTTIRKADIVKMQIVELA